MNVREQLGIIGDFFAYVVTNIDGFPFCDPA